jgi:hypothetical protein
VNSQALDFLHTSQNADGGWGYAAPQASGVEPTSAVLLAAHQDLDEAALQKAVAWLLSCQHADGSWGINPQDAQGCWLTAWAVYALAKIQPGAQPAQAGIEWLMGENVMQISNLDDLEAGQRVAKIDFSLRGWPWQPGEASWVEPTALALLAMSAHRVETARIAESVQYLVNRRCPGGGWNVGNPVMFNAALPARAHPTAWTLLALAHTDPQAVLDEDLESLRAEMLRDDGIQALSWGSLALSMFGVQEELAFWRLIESQSADGSWNANPYETAAACLALEAHSKTV